MEQDEANLGIVSKKHIEELASFNGLELSNSQWERIRNEIEGRVENFVEGLLDDLISDLQEGIFDE